MEQATNPVWPYGIYYGADVGDLDGDGDLDLVLGFGQPGQNRLYRNDGNRVFTDVTAATLPAVLDHTRAVRLFDADGDGDRDIFFGNSGQSRLLRNDGSLVFTEVTSTALPFGGWTRDVAIGDVDSDGDLDIVRGVYDAANELWRNNGGVFQLAVGSLPPVAQAHEAIALADLDGDQDLDLIEGNYSYNGIDPRSWIRWNDGTGNFMSPPLLLGSIDVRAIAVGDIEGDGDVDFVLAGEGTPPRLFENFGSGLLFSQASAFPAEPRMATRVALVDVEGDGDLDLVEGDRQRNRVLVNLHRQLVSRQLLVPGGSAEFEAFAANTGPAGSLSAAAVFIGLPAAPTITPFGVARLDLNTLVPLTLQVVIPPFPSISAGIQVPATPAVLGFVIGAQMLALHDSSNWRLSGLVLETVRQ